MLSSNFNWIFVPFVSIYFILFLFFIVSIDECPLKYMYTIKLKLLLILAFALTLMYQDVFREKKEEMRAS